MYSVLILEPDFALASTMHQVLVKQGYFVKVTHSLSRAYELLEQRCFDVVVMAHDFPDGNARELVDYLRRFSFQTRSMVVAKSMNYQDRISAYKKGVDDFMVKPFNVTELCCRVQMLCHRQKVLQRHAVTLCDAVSIYPQEGLLQVRDESQRIPRKESQILACLIRHRSRVVGRDELVRWVWQESEAQPKPITLDVYIKRIRLRLGTYSDRLETVRGFGYRIRE